MNHAMKATWLGLPKDFVESESYASDLFCIKRTRLKGSQCKQCNGLFFIN